MASYNFKRFNERRSDYNNIAESHQSQERPGNFNCLARILEKQRAERKAQSLAQAASLCAAEQARINSVRKRLGLSILEDPLLLPQPQAEPRKRPELSAQGGRIRPVIHLPPLNAEVVTEDKTFRTHRHQRSLEIQNKEVKEVFSGSDQTSKLAHLPQTTKTHRGNMTPVTPAPPPTPAPSKTPAPPRNRVTCRERSLQPARTVNKGRETETTSELGLLYPDIEEEWRRLVQNKERKQRDKEERKRLAQLHEWNKLPNGRSTTAELRPTADLQTLTDLLPLPKPYGAQSPFRPSKPGANMRHIRKQTVKPIEDLNIH